MLRIKDFGVSSASRYLKYLRFMYCERKKSYYNDKHEDGENVRDRIEFINNYHKYELRAEVWVQSLEEEAKKMEEEGKILPDCHAYQYDNMREYHIDTHPDFYEIGGRLSVRKEPNEKQVVIYGQDETVIKQNTYSNRTWHNHKGASKLLPKTDGYSKMLSVMVGRKFGFGIHLSDVELEEINKRRTDENSAFKEYTSIESAMEIYGTVKKKPLTAKHQLVQYFNLGINQDGFWNYHHMALQNEDAFDVLAIKYPHCDFLMLTDRSCGHGKRKEDGLDAKEMSVRWGGKKYKMRETVVKENGPYQCTHHINDRQCMQFEEGDDGPFFMSAQERERQKLPFDTGKERTRERTKKELLLALKEKGFPIKGVYDTETLHNHARKYDLPIIITEKIIRPGWLGTNKGLLQALYERGWIDKENWRKYTLSGRESEKDENGKVKEEFLPYVLRDLMANCADFKEEKSAMEDLFQKLSAKGPNKIELLPSPKYHPEIAGEGVEFAFGLLKKMYRSIPLVIKKGKENFEKAIEQSVRFITRIHMNKFAGKCRRYMLAYMNQAKLSSDSPPSLTLEGIEKFQKSCKTHRNTADMDKGYITQIFVESCSVKNGNREENT